jgi:hypothetical protein
MVDGPKLRKQGNRALTATNASNSYR